MPLSCRFYQQKYPEIEDCVMVNVRSIAEMGAYVSLLEYNNIEGMILLSELSRRRIRSVNKLIRVGRSECVVVIRVDKDKGYIDLSKRRVYSKDLIQCEERFAKAKAVNSILRHVADQLNYDTDEQLEDLYQRSAWYFDQKYGKKAACYDIFKKAIADPSVLDDCKLDVETREKLLEDIRKRLTPQSVKIRADIEVSCYAYEGIDAVRAALKEGLKVVVPTIEGIEDETALSNGMAPINEELNGEELPTKKYTSLQIQLIAPPQYVVTTSTYERELGLAAVNDALDRIKASILQSKGNFKVLMAPKVVTDLDEKEIKRKLELLELESAEVPGDDDAGSEGEQEGMQAPEDLDRAFEAKLQLDKEKGVEAGSDEGEDDDIEEK